MRLFLCTYSDERNFVTTKNFGIFGAKIDEAGMGTKVQRLRRGDLIIYRDGSIVNSCKLLGCSFVTGSVYNQYIESPYRELIWNDEVRSGKIIYPLRVPIDCVTAPEISKDIEWNELSNLNFFNKKGQPIITQQGWGKKFIGNFIENKHEILKFSILLEIPLYFPIFPQDMIENHNYLRS